MSSSSFLASFTPLRQSLPNPPHKPSSAACRRTPNLVVSASATATDHTPRLRFAVDMSVRPSSLYEVLAIPRTASCQEIKAAYRKLARTWHPDVAAVNQKENSANEFIKIQAAYSTLSDPAKRANYDREFYRTPLSSRPSPVSGYSGYYTRRNWESDQCW